MERKAQTIKKRTITIISKAAQYLDYRTYLHFKDTLVASNHYRNCKI